MSTKYPATAQLSLEEFSRHGGLSGPHKDGWSIAWYEDREVRVVKETFPVARSARVRFIHDNPFVTTFALSHVRKAMRGDVALRNCRPLVRELGGGAWPSVGMWVRSHEPEAPHKASAIAQITMREFMRTCRPPVEPRARIYSLENVWAGQHRNPDLE